MFWDVLLFFQLLTLCIPLCLPFFFTSPNKMLIFLSSFPPLQFFHFSSRAFLPPDGQFGGRIRWQGTPARGDASIALINATLNDNGTFTCSVRNPPDVHGSPTSHTVLTVAPKGKTRHIHTSPLHRLYVYMHFDYTPIKALNCVNI